MNGSNPTTSLRTTARRAASVLLALVWLAAVPPARALDGTYRVTETWRVVLEYDGWGDNGYTGTKTFTGTQSGTMVFRGTSYQLVNRAGVQLSGIEDLTTRTIFYNGANASISGSYVFGPAFGATARGIVFLGAFIVSVPLLDGEVPAFFGFDSYSGFGPLAEIEGGGDMRGLSLTATVSSTLSLERVLGPPSIITQPQNQSVFAGQDATFSVTAGGDGPLSYFWRKNGAVLPGRTGPTLRLANVQPSDAGTYSVIVSNSASKVTSANANLTVKASPPAWQEGWESSPLGLRPPLRNVTTFVSGDKGRWLIGDTVSFFDDCGPIESYAEVLTDGGRKLLRLVSRQNGFGCAENLDVQLSSLSSSSLPLPLVRGTEISFFERGAMDNPQWNGLFGCISRPCGDTVHLRLVDDRANEVLYIFQRASNYVEHAFTNGPSLSGYLEIFLDPAGGTFRRNLFDDFARIAGAAGPGQRIQGVGFAIGAAGWAMLDDLRIGPTNAATASDTAAPSVVITSPANNARLLTPSAMLTGTARDNVAVSLVEVQLNEGAFQPATGTTAWAADLTLLPGQNTVRVRAKDAAGNTSPEVSRSFIYVVSDVLTLNISGQGTVSPNLGGQRLEVGKSYTVTAKPATGWVFAGWSGGTNSSTAKPTFFMRPGLELVANFIPNPFIPIKGAYNGLFLEDPPRPESSGFFTLTLAERGTYTTRLQSGGKTLSASGAFDLAGRATNVIARSGTNPLRVVWDLLLAGGMEKVAGQVSDGTWMSELSGDRASTNAGMYQGRYTLAIPGTADSSGAPGGHSFGSVTIDSRGNLSFSGTLAHGATAQQRVPVSHGGRWPFYLWNNVGKDMLIGWVNFGDDGANDLAGSVHWFKSALSTAKYYPDGFALESSLTGSRYLAPVAPALVLNFTAGRLVLTGAGIESTNGVMLLSNNKLIAAGPGTLTFALDVAKGLFSGSVTPPDLATGIAVKGALLQRQISGAGYFLNNAQSGGVTVEPAP